MADWVRDAVAEVFHALSPRDRGRWEQSVAGRCRSALKESDSVDALLSALGGEDPSLRCHATPGRTLLHVAARYGRRACAAALLGAGARTADVDDDGATPLHLAAFYGHESTCEILVRAGAPMGVQNGRGETPEDCARAARRYALAARLAQLADAPGQSVGPGDSGNERGPPPSLWLRLRAPARRVALQRGAGAVFSVPVAGSAPAAPGCIVRVDASHITVGRASQCVLRVRDASLSNHHAAISLGTATRAPAPLGCHYRITSAAATPPDAGCGTCDEDGALAVGSCLVNRDGDAAGGVRGGCDGPSTAAGGGGGDGKDGGGGAAPAWWVADVGSLHGTFVGVDGGGGGHGSGREPQRARLSDSRAPSPWHPLGSSAEAVLWFGDLRAAVLATAPAVPLEEVAAATAADGGRAAASGPLVRPTGPDRKRGRTVLGWDDGMRGGLRPQKSPLAAPIGGPGCGPGSDARRSHLQSYRDRAAERRERHGRYSSLDAALRQARAAEEADAAWKATAPAGGASGEVLSARGLGFAEGPEEPLLEAAGSALASGDRRSVAWAKTTLRAAAAGGAGGATGPGHGRQPLEAPTFVRGGLIT